jgi:hypothetical protein
LSLVYICEYLSVLVLPARSLLKTIRHLLTSLP